jgi:dihydrofolate reductase
MGRIIVSENVTLDGVVQDPTGEDGFERGGWLGRIGDHGRQDAARIALEEALSTDAMLLGRRTYEFLAARWPTRSGDLAVRLNSKPKYVVSSTLAEPTWAHTILLRGDVAKSVSALKHEVNGDIAVAGSFRLLPNLFAHDLVDELRLMVYPVILGAGARLFDDITTKLPMRLVGNETIDDLAYLTYELARDA